MAKSKAGKKQKDRKLKKGAKVAQRKAPRRAAPRKPAPVSTPAEQSAQAAKAPPEYPWNVIVNKGHDKLPVTVTDQAHFERLCTEFGAEHVEVQS